MLTKCFSQFLQLTFLKNSVIRNFIKTTSLNGSIIEDEKQFNLYHNYVTRNKTKLYFSSSSKKSKSKSKTNEILDKFPSKLFKRKSSLKNLYIAHPDVANTISDHLKKNLKKSDTILEVNPGPGLLTNELLKADISKIILIEAIGEFLKDLKSIELSHPERVKLKHGDFINIWKLAFRDKMDNGTRLADLLNHVPKKKFDDEPNMKVIATVSSLNFFKHLINSLVFEKSLYTYGRCEMYLVIPALHYTHLTCSREIGYLLYRATSILFQIMFEYQLLAEFPKDYFLPLSNSHHSAKLKKLSQAQNINLDSMYLIRIIPRRNLYELCPSEYMQSLWYFVKQNCISRRTRIIPNLEKWIPGCGIRLIVKKPNSTGPAQRLFSDDNNHSIKLPMHSQPCIVMNTEDYYPEMNIFTEFGDLTPSQMLSLFSLFRSWPEYKTSSFLASLETSLIKMESSDVNETESTINEEPEINTNIHDREISEINYVPISTDDIISDEKM